MCMYVHNEVCICNGMYWNLVTWELTSPCVGLLSFQSKHQALNWLTRQSLMELWTTLFAIRGGKDSCLLLDEYTTLDCWWAPNTHPYTHMLYMCTHIHTVCCAHITYIKCQSLCFELHNSEGYGEFGCYSNSWLDYTCQEWLQYELDYFHFLSSEMMASLPTLHLDFCPSSSMWRPLRVMRVLPLQW